MTTDSNHSENTDGSNSTESNYLAATLERLTGEPPRVEQCVDETGRFWLQDRKNPDDAYLWSRQTIDVEAVR